MTKAPVGKRIVAYLIDAVLVMAIVFIFGIGGMVAIMGITFVAAALTKGLGALLGFLAIPVYGIVLLVALGYWLFRDGLNGGRSFGKKFMGLKVVKDGAPCKYMDSLLRNITLIVPLLNIVDLVMGLVDAEGKRIGDKIAKTHVVEA
jgi:uncharacterized RDD family membrane protein YckC